MKPINIYSAIRKLKAKLKFLLENDGSEESITEIKNAIIHFNDKLKKNESLN